MMIYTFCIYISDLFSNTLEKSVRTPILSSACLDVWSLQISFPVPQPVILHFKMLSQRVYHHPPVSRSTPVRGSAVNLRCIVRTQYFSARSCSHPNRRWLVPGHEAILRSRRGSIATRQGIYRQHHHHYHHHGQACQHLNCGYLTRCRRWWRCWEWCWDPWVHQILPGNHI